MGYRSFIRSVNASANRARRAQQMHQRQSVRLHERFDRKLQGIQTRRAKPKQKLDELYAAGKISKKTYEELAFRDKDITIDLIVFGHAAGQRLGERFLIGNISADEFEALKNEILSEPEREKDAIIEDYRKRVDETQVFFEKARANRKAGVCGYCGREKKWYSRLHKESDFQLCSACKANFDKLRAYPGYAGQFYTVAPGTVVAKGQSQLVVNIRQEYILGTQV